MPSRDLFTPRHDITNRQRTARPAGHLNAGSVREADQRSQLKCLCSEVICHWRGFPHRGVGLTAVEGKDRLSVVDLTPCAPVLFTCLLFLQKRRNVPLGIV